MIKIGQVLLRISASRPSASFFIFKSRWQKLGDFKESAFGTMHGGVLSGQSL
jgi:hypothetical protein